MTILSQLLSHYVVINEKQTRLCGVINDILTVISRTVGRLPGLCEGVGLLHFMNNESMT